jgi:hypothetical protein
MAFHRLSGMLSVTTPPIPKSTFHDMQGDGRAPLPDAYNGRIPLFSDETREQFKQSLMAAARRTAARVRRAPKPAAPVETSPTT